MLVLAEEVGPDHRDMVRKLLEFNAYEFSRFDGADLDDRGTFGYPWLDLYWTEADRHPFIVRADGQIAGLCLVRLGTPNAIAEFLILPKYRRSGVGTTAARSIFARFPGDWETHEIAGNGDAVDFWRAAIPVEFVESVDAGGTTQRFAISD